MIKHYSEGDDLTEVFVGHRIVKAEVGVTAPRGEGRWGYESAVVDGTDPVGLLTLDDGTHVYVVGNDGGCACSAGCYSLERLAKVDNIITSVTVKSPENDHYGELRGTYSIFVVTENEALSVADFEGDDGNGYYGTGFHLAVVPAAAVSA